MRRFYVDQSLVCDSVKDCPHGEDEKRCATLINNEDNDQNKSILALQIYRDFFNQEIFYLKIDQEETIGSTYIKTKRYRLPKEIDIALRKTSLEILHSEGDNSTVRIGTCSMDIKSLIENIIVVIEEIKENDPGGWEKHQMFENKDST